MEIHLKVQLNNMYCQYFYGSLYLEIKGEIKDMEVKEGEIGIGLITNGVD